MTPNCKVLSRPHPLLSSETAVGNGASLPLPPSPLPAKQRELAAKVPGQPEKGRAPFLIEVMGAWPQSSRDREFQLGFRKPLMEPAWKTNDPTVQPDAPFPGEELGHLPIL